MSILFSCLDGLALRKTVRQPIASRKRVRQTGRVPPTHYLNLTQVGEMLGVTRQRALQYADSDVEFPLPAVVVGTVRGWARADILRYRRARERRKHTKEAGR